MNDEWNVPVISPAHSYILCLDDSYWAEEFTAEVAEMINEGSPKLPQVGSEVGQLLEDLRHAGSADKHGVDCSDNTVDPHFGHLERSHFFTLA